MDLSKFIVGDFVWVPITIFFVIMAIGAIFGFVKGWKSSLYFFIGNIGLGLILFFIYKPIYNLMIDKFLPNQSADITQLVFPYFGPLYLFIGFLVINFLLGLAYLIFGHYNKKSKQTTYIDGKAVVTKPKKPFLSRLFGLGFSSATSFVIGVTAFQTASVFFVDERKSPEFRNSSFYEFINDSTSKLTGDKFYSSIDLQSFLLMGNQLQGQNKDIWDVVLNLFEKPESINDAQIKLWNENKKDLELILNNSDLTKVIVPYLLPDNFTSRELTSDLFNNQIEPELKKLDPLNVNHKSQKIFEKQIKEHIKFESPEAEKLITEQILKDFFI